MAPPLHASHLKVITSAVRSCLDGQGHLCGITTEKTQGIMTPKGVYSPLGTSELANEEVISQPCPIP
uniref:PH01B019A14.18 protein n=1 Tax=Phyllostachys edulis TaxID=38705 RepID=L0P1N7_PHYED|nr:PH01B019A14.18 [Phyllostachys edulis]